MCAESLFISYFPSYYVLKSFLFRGKTTRENLKKQATADTEE